MVAAAFLDDRRCPAAHQLSDEDKATLLEIQDRATGEAVG